MNTCPAQSAPNARIQWIDPLLILYQNFFYHFVVFSVPTMTKVNNKYFPLLYSLVIFSHLQNNTWQYEQKWKRIKHYFTEEYFCRDIKSNSIFLFLFRSNVSLDLEKKMNVYLYPNLFTRLDWFYFDSNLLTDIYDVVFSKVNCWLELKHPFSYSSVVSFFAYIH